MSRAPKHFPFINAVGEVIFVGCSCDKNFILTFRKTAVGEQEAREAAISHSASRRIYDSVSRLVAEPQFAFEVESNA